MLRDFTAAWQKFYRTRGISSLTQWDQNKIIDNYVYKNA